MAAAVLSRVAALSLAVASVVEEDAVSLLQRSAVRLRQTLTDDQSNAELLDADGGSFCDQGKLLPELYVLGAQKASTTSFAHDLMEAGILAATGASQKEFHFFDWDAKRLAQAVASDVAHTLAAESSQEAVRATHEIWLQKLLDCPTGPQKQVSADFTPRNLRLTSLPSGVLASQAGIAGWFPYGGVWAQAHSEVGLLPDAPHALRSFYGAKSQSLTMVVMLREPSSRMLSHWFDPDCNVCRNSTAAGMTFEQAVVATLREVRRSPPRYPDWFWANFYGAQIEKYLKDFDADQLVVVPYLQYTKLNKVAIFEHLSARLGVPLSVTSGAESATAASHLNSQAHPGIEESLSLDTRQELEVLLAADKRKLVEVLADARRQGAWLAGFEGRSDADVLEWLEGSW